MSIQKPLLLVVEDNLTQQKVFNILADRYGYSAVVVGSGDEAISAVSATGTDYDAILMDWQLPDMDGIECTARIREFENLTGKRTPIIACTAHSMDGERRMCIEAGMDDYMSKPFSPDDFRRILLKWAYHPDSPNLRLLPQNSAFI